jgi:hypothetical protein
MPAMTVVASSDPLKVLLDILFPFSNAARGTAYFSAGKPTLICSS